MPGAFGGVLAFLGLGLIAASYAADDKIGWALIFLILGAGFVPAVFVSLTANPRRNAVLRGSTILAMLIALFGIFVDYGIPFVMSPGTILLAQGAGLIFQRSQRR